MEASCHAIERMQRSIDSSSARVVLDSPSCYNIIDDFKSVDLFGRKLQSSED